MAYNGSNLCNAINSNELYNDINKSRNLKKQLFLFLIVNCFLKLWFILDLDF